MQLAQDPLVGRLKEVAGKDEGKVIQAEEDVVPGRTVPQAVAEPDAEQGDTAGQNGTEMVTQLFRAFAVSFFSGADRETG